MSVISQREAYGLALREFGAQSENIVVLDADTSCSTLSSYFAEAFPERFINVGIAEPCLVDAAVGLALGGLIPFVNAFSALLSLRALEQIRTCVAYAHTNVKLAASYAGLSDYKDGPTHHSIIDIGIMRMLPGMTVIVPSDALEIKAWVPVIAAHQGPVYLRLSRAGTENVHAHLPQVQIGKGFRLREGRDVSILCTGVMTYRGLQAAEALAHQGIEAAVLGVPCIKPMDEKLILNAAEATGAIVTAEEHSILGGLGGAVAEILASTRPTPMERVGIQDVFAKTGPDPESLMDACGLSVADIQQACHRVITRKSIS
jgi:transketolase